MDIELAREFGCRIKLLAISRNHGDHVEARVHPTMVPQKHLLASINGAFNAIHFQGDMVGNVLLYGLGAGMIPTGSAVAADVVDIARNIACGSIGRVPALSYLPEQMQPRRITPMEELYGPYYFRLTVLDQPGVLAAIAGILSKYEISIESVIQKGRKKNGCRAPGHRHPQRQGVGGERRLWTKSAGWKPSPPRWSRSVFSRRMSDPSPGCTWRNVMKYILLIGDGMGDVAGSRPWQPDTP
jgi:hypothetical protein